MKNRVRPSAETLYWIKWMLVKLATKDLFYLPRRISYSIRRKVSDQLFSQMLPRLHGTKFGPIVPPYSEDARRYFLERAVPRFHFVLLKDIEEICASIPIEKKSQTIKQAERIVHGEFTFRGRDPVVLNPIEWDYPKGTRGGWICDLNRHFFFSTLGFAYWHTGDERFFDSFAELSTSWIRTHVHRLGLIKWDDPFEVAARINGWIWSYFLFRHCSKWDAENQIQFLKALGCLSEYLYHVIEYHSFGNHLLLEAKALAICAGLFPEFNGAEKWGKKAWKILERETQTQILPDGVHAERSTMYHRIVAGELGELLLFSLNNEMPQSEALLRTVSGMAEFEEWITCQKNGYFPTIGDAYLKDTCYRFSAPAIASKLSGSIATTINDPPIDEQTYWLLGSHLKKKDSLKKELPDFEQLAKSFSSGGYYVSRSSWNGMPSILVWDCGPVGHRPSLYHSHLDALSFTMTIDGIPLFVDPGTHEGDEDLRHYLRGTSAHNTVVVDGIDQAILAKHNEVWKPYQSKLLFFGSDADCDIMIGSHNGYRRLPEPVEHFRLILNMRGIYYLIYDKVCGQGSHPIQQRFHLAPDIRVDEIWPADFSFNQESCVARMKIIDFMDASMQATSVRINLQKGISSMEFGKIRELSVIELSYAGPLPFSAAAILVPPDNPILIDGCKSACKTSYDLVKITTADFVDKIFIRLADGSEYFADGWSTNASVLILRCPSGVSEPDWGIVANGTILSRQSEGMTFKPKMLEKVRFIKTG